MGVKVKICGICGAEDARAAEAAGADFVGLIFEPSSPRAVSVAEAAKISGALRGGAKAVGVFVNQAPEFIAAAAAECGLFALQLHGGISSEFACTPDFSVREIWRAVWLESPLDAEAAAGLPCDAAVADSRSKSSPGGTGKLSDWGLAALLARKKRLVLAGGISPENVSAAVRSVRPWAVDANSGVEETPRKKDLKKMEALIEKAKNPK